MFRITKLADYGILLMSSLAADRRPGVHTARDLANSTGIPLPTVSKILKALARHGLLASHRGVGGGFALAREARSISVAEVVSALEGPIALTACLDHDAETCGIESSCPVRTNWERINDAVRGALEGLTIAEMAAPQFAFRAPAPRGATPLAAAAPSSAPLPDETR